MASATAPNRWQSRPGRGLVFGERSAQGRGRKVDTGSRVHPLQEGDSAKSYDEGQQGSSRMSDVMVRRLSKTGAWKARDSGGRIAGLTCMATWRRGTEKEISTKDGRNEPPDFFLASGFNVLFRRRPIHDGCDKQNSSRRSRGLKRQVWVHLPRLPC